MLHNLYKLIETNIYKLKVMRTITNIFQAWASSTLAKQGKEFGYWLEDMKKKDSEPDALTIIFMSHYLKKNITLVSGKCDEWKVDDITDDIVLLYKGDNVYMPMDVGIYIFNCNVFANVDFFKQTIKHLCL